METRIAAALILWLLALSGTGLAQPSPGQRPPGDQPALFAPGVVSTGNHELSISFSPDARTLYLTVTGPTYAPRFLLRSTWAPEGWTPLCEVPFASADRQDSYPFIAPDGLIYFNSMRGSRDGPALSREIWVVEAGRSSPVRIEVDQRPLVGTFPSVAANGNIYFNRMTEGGDSDIFVARRIAGGYRPAERLGSAVNGPGGDFHPFIAADENYLLFDSGRPGGHGANDLYLCRRAPDGDWRPARNLGPTVNGPSADMRPFVTSDGAHLFFVSDRTIAWTPPPGPLDPAGVDAALHRPGNGLQDIYWVDADCLDALLTGTGP